VAAGYVRQRPERVWAVEGANGTDRPLTARLLADGETVVDVPAKLAAPGVRVSDTGHGRKTDATDAHSIVMVALRTRGLTTGATSPEWSIVLSEALRSGQIVVRRDLIIEHAVRRPARGVPDDEE
jgi:transposase